MQRDLINKYFTGYIELSLEEGYYFLYRFGKEQRRFYDEEMGWYGMMSCCQAGIVLRANRCHKIVFDFICKTGQKEVVFETLTDSNKVTRHVFATDLGRAEFFFNEKDVMLYFPYDVHLGIRNIEIIGEPAEQKERVILAFGDSITQGYSTDEPSQTYASEVARGLNATLYNFRIYK